MSRNPIKRRSPILGQKKVLERQAKKLKEYIRKHRKVRGITRSMADL